MTKVDLASLLAEQFGKTHTESMRILDLIFSSVAETIIKGERVYIKELGVFLAKDQKPRVGRNPRTGERIDIPAMRVVKFKPAKELKETTHTSSKETSPEERDLLIG